MTYWFYDFSRGVLWFFFRLGFGLEVRGQKHVPTTGPVLIACNHVSYLDPPVLGAACPRRLGFMARATLFESPGLGAFMRGVHVIPLQRGEHDVGAIREAVRRLHRGEAIAIFPEGGRQFSGALGTAKRGVGLLAETGRAPIVPAVIDGTFEALPPHTRRLHRTKIRVAFGPQIPYTTSPTPTPAPDEPVAAHETVEQASRHRHEALAARVTEQWHRLRAQLIHG